MKIQLLAMKIELDLMIIIMRSLLNTIPNQKPRNLKMVILLMSRKSLMMQMQKQDSIQKKILRKMSQRTKMLLRNLMKPKRQSLKMKSPKVQRMSQKTKRLLRNLMVPKRQNLKVQKMSQMQMKKQIWMPKGTIKERRRQAN